MSHGTIVRALRGLGLAAMAAFLTAESCPKDIGEGDQPGVYTVRVSLDKDGLQVLTPLASPIGNQSASISDDGRFVAFQSDSPQLVLGDANGKRDIFVKDRFTGAVELVSVNTDAGTAADEDCIDPALSGDGRFVVYASAGNLGGGAFWTGGNTRLRLFRYDRLLKVTRAVWASGSVPNSTTGMLYPAISSDGRYVTFSDSATNILVGPTYNGLVQVFLADLGDPNGPFTATVFTLISQTAAGTNTACGGFCDASRVCVLPNGTPFVVFDSNADNLVSPVPSPTGETRVYGGSPGSICEMISLTDADVPSNGLCNKGSVSRDGRYVSFTAFATNITGSVLTPNLVAVRDRTLGTTTVISYDPAGNPIIGSFNSSISADGQSVAFAARPTGGGGGFQQIWIRDSAGARIASLHLSGAIADKACHLPSLSGDGRWVAWHSDATNLVTSDTNGQHDIFARGPLR